MSTPGALHIESSGVGSFAPLRGRSRRSLLFGLAVFQSTCTSPTDSTPVVASISIAGPTSLVVREKVLFLVTATDASGRSVLMTQPLEWSSSNLSVAAVSGAGVVTGVSRGSTRLLVRSGGVEASLELVVHARVKVSPPPVRWAEQSGGHTVWQLAVGDTVRLTAEYVDIDGVSIDAVPETTWRSSDPAAMSVSVDGTVQALRAQAAAYVTALTPDGADSVYLQGSDVMAGRTATVRFTHGLAGAGPISFLPNKGDPVTLSFGESLERPLPSGTFYVYTQGIPATRDTASWYREYAAIVREGDHLSLYAVGEAAQGYLSAAWTTATTVASDSVRFRLVQGDGTYGVVLALRTTEEASSGVLLECYFDPLGVTTYHGREAGDFDLVLQPKYGAALQERLRASIPAGRSATLVITGSAPPSLLLLVDP